MLTFIGLLLFQMFFEIFVAEGDIIINLNS